MKKVTVLNDLPSSTRLRVGMTKAAETLVSLAAQVKDPKKAEALRNRAEQIKTKARSIQP